MTAASPPKRVLPFAVIGARTNTGAVFLDGCSTSATEFCGKRAVRVGDVLIDPVDGEVTVISGLGGVAESGRLFAGLGSVLSNNSYIVDAGQDKIFSVEFEDGTATLFVAEDARA